MKNTSFELAGRWLRQPLMVRNVGRRTFPLGPAIQDEIVTTNRLILVLRGRLDYTAEGRTLRMRAGTQFLVPAWVRRAWSVPRGGPCEIIWCEFDDAGLQSGWTTCGRRQLDGGELGREKKRYLNLWRLFRRRLLEAGAWRELELESELKGLLVRFLKDVPGPLGSGPGSEEGEQAPFFHPRVKQMLKWLGEHFLEEGVLAGLYAECGMTRNYFRRLFTAVMECAPQVHIERLRLRHARYLLHETDRPVKQIAGECGYHDALYFSRAYHRFWGHSPMRERRVS